MRITCRDRVLEHRCLVETFERPSDEEVDRLFPCETPKVDLDRWHKACLCHIDPRLQFDELIDGCCAECSCPKTEEAFNRLWEVQEGIRSA
jgi:hypothetical protein